MKDENSGVSVKPSSVADFQALNEKIYGKVNGRYFDIRGMFSRIHRYSAQVLDCVCNERYPRAAYPLTVAESWCFALGNRLHVNLGAEIWERFPGRCQRCLKSHCACHGKERTSALKDLGDPDYDRPDTLQGYQDMLARIYKEASSKDRAIRLAVDTGKLDEALEFFLGTHETGRFQEAVARLADVSAGLLIAASSIGIDITDALVNMYTLGCPKCGQMSCVCDYTTAKMTGD